MAVRYWVGGTGTWGSVNTDHWSASSGGSSGASYPTASDDVYFDANSGGGTCTTSNTPGYYYYCKCKNLNLTGYTGTLSISVSVSQGDNRLWIHGDLTLGSTVTITGAGIMYIKRLGAAVVQRTITSNGSTIGTELKINDSVILDDDLVVTKMIYLEGVYGQANSVFNASNHNVKSGCLFWSSLVTLTMGSGTFELTGEELISGKFWAGSCAVTYNTSTIKYTGSVNAIFDGDGYTFYNFWQAGTGIVTMTGSNTFNDMKADANTTLKITGGTTQTISSLTMVGTSGNLVTFQSTNTTDFILSDSAGTNDCDYLDISYCTAQGGATFQVGYNSLVSNITGWDETGFANPANAYADDASYATGNSSSGVTFVALSWDGGATWTSVLDQTLAAEATKTYGDGSTELWGRAWVGDDVDDTSFRVKITFAGGRSQIYKTFGFAPGAAVILTGIEVTINGAYAADVTSIDHLAVKIYYGSSTLPIQAGSQSYASDGRKAGEGGGAGTGVLTFYDGSNWIACDTGATVAA